MPRLFIQIIFAALVMTPFNAYAGDMAYVRILGFSSDGAVFAFEEFGVQDGSGFPYANRFYIDTATDTFVKGTPIRVRLDNEQATVEEARKETEIPAQSIISDDELTENLGFTAGWNSITELSADPHHLLVNPRPVFPPIDPLLAFRLEEKHMQPPHACAELGEHIMGFRLLRLGTEPGEETRILHEDHRIPDSRSCPLGYRIAGIQTIYPDNAPPVFAVMIAVRRLRRS